MPESSYKVPVNPTVNRGSGWAVDLRTFAIIITFDHALWR